MPEAAVASSGSPVDDLFSSVVATTDRHFALEQIDIDPELAQPKSLLKILDATHYNWQADRFRKIFGMRFKVKLPPLDQLNSIFYPQPDYDTPIFLKGFQVGAYLQVVMDGESIDAEANVWRPFVARTR